MKTVQQTKSFNASAEIVFDKIDDLGVTGMHMTQSSMPMMGGKMNLEFLTKHKRGLHSRYKWTGNVLWMALEFTVEVTKWQPWKYKSWETVGPAKLIIYSWFRMELRMISSSINSSEACLSIIYERPHALINRVLCFFIGDWYARWCLDNMLNDVENKISMSLTAQGSKN
jgi:hypothetical protein